ncbi:heavy metal translocating P-type ATPase [Leucobacter luti]|uniref:P-type E1-E2 ATPase/heavy metal translocating P-type ATPase n=1 Tax=Leucobacter luti TaxID=340320 RepID=A0A4Q7TSG1_9MICO|nr:heavy metal translocating P-type ATPase [Leucobacter luti]MBL3700026.1 heavy metal translocating P-type ATPase [Leucobacter luti]RZT62658.1 P-type E1-E2 ATPase/heavy metal translocating P-type ATPase [Leucobacter luti]
MDTLRRAMRAYPFVAATIAVGVVGLLLLATPASYVAPWLVGVYALGIAAWQAVGMVRQLLRGHAGLDILAVTAIVAAVLVGEPWAALVVVLMLTGGEALEDYAENRSKRELTALLDRAPSRATRIVPGIIDEDGMERTETVDVQEIGVGDVLLVRPGALVPVDAILLDDTASFDESSLTGESLPVERAAGEKVASGVVNGAAAIRMRATALAGDSQYQQIVRLVEEAQSSKAKTVRLADRYAVPFTLFSLALAGIAWAVSGDAVRFAEVLVVATPCPLLIAAPVAFLGGMSRAAQAGLIVKGGGTLEQLARVRSAAFDKTGTLTTGKPEPRRILPQPGFTEEDVLQLAASAEVYSSHVLASAVVDSAKARGVGLLAVTDAEEHATNGVTARLAGGVVRVGKPAWVREAAPGLVHAELEAGELAIYVSRNDRFAGAIVMRDRLRDDAIDTIAELHGLGVSRMLVVTGDVAATANPLAAQLRIGEVHAECTPADKVRIVAEVEPRPLLMTGDGLNDAPVLAAADIGFAMGARGSTAASESADVVNRFDRIGGVADAIRIGRDTVRIAVQSIWLGIAFSVALMLIAAFGFLPALVGAWLQEVVDLVAILGALRAIRGPRTAPDRAARAVEATAGADQTV